MKRQEAIKIRQAIEQGATSLPVETALEVPMLFKKWTAGENVNLNDIRQYEGTLYEVVQAHTTQENWTPEATPALWKVVVPDGVIPEWKQPLGVHDAYQIGDKVKFNGNVYESLINANTYSPTDYPAGWKKL